MTAETASGRAVGSVVDAAVDGAAALYADAGERAYRKWPHQGPKGSLVLEYSRRGAQVCGGKLLTASVRVMGPPLWKTRWTAVGVVCMHCGAWWPKPPDDGVAVSVAVDDVADDAEVVRG